MKDKMVVEKAIEAGIMFAGTPDQVYRQIKKHYEFVGGYGHLLIMGQAGFLEHDETVEGDQDIRARGLSAAEGRVPEHGDFGGGPVGGGGVDESSPVIPAERSESRNP